MDCHARASAEALAVHATENPKRKSSRPPIEFVRPPVALTEPDRPAVVHFTSGAEVGVRETVADLLKRFVAEA